ncbi:hypothetical protein LINGRAHAP2_LOCUS21966 [Linum grandiflorum]
MIKSEFLFSHTQQILKHRLTQIRQWHHKSLLLCFTDVYRQEPLWHIRKPCFAGARPSASKNVLNKVTGQSNSHDIDL